jgi:hypothetical protein
MVSSSELLPPAGTAFQWGVVGSAGAQVLCSHEMTRTERTHHGSFMVLTTVCTRCGKLLGEEKVLALEHMRCLVDPRLERCVISCPVEEGSLVVFENPCEPVKKLIMSAGMVPMVRPEALTK